MFKTLFLFSTIVALVGGVTARAHSAPDLLFQYQFAGTAALSTNKDAAKLKEVFELEQTKALAEQVVLKLARTPELAIRGNGDLESESARLLRPLIENLFTLESYAEVRRGENTPGEMVFAARVGKNQGLWQTNLQAAVARLANRKPQKADWEKFSGWELKTQSSPGVVRAIHAGDWIVIGIGDGELPLQNNLLRRIATGKRPADWKGTTNWFEATIDMPKLQKWLPVSKLPLKPALTEIALSSRDNAMRTHIRAVYPEAVPWKPVKWQVPTNVIRDPIVAFTAGQNPAALLNAHGNKQGSDFDPLRNQFFVWAYPQLPMMTYAAMPVKDSAKAIQLLSTNLPQMFNAHLEANGRGKIGLSSNKQSIVWTGLSMIVPELRATNEAAGQFLLATAFPLPPTKDPVPAELLEQFVGRTNVIFYDWEITSQRLGPWQMLTKMIPGLGPVRPPIAPEVAAAAKTNEAVRKQLATRILHERWQSKVAPLLGNVTTEVTLQGPNEVQVLRKSDLGFTSLELIYLTHWLNHPEFPFVKRKQ